MKVRAKKFPLVKQNLGPTPYEIQYFAQLQRELELFLRSRNFTTVDRVDIAFQGPNFKAYVHCHK